VVGLLGARVFLRSFRGRDFRYLWASDALQGWADQMESVVLGWFVLTETDSPFLVGLFAALRFTGTIFAPFFGVLADRRDRRRLLMLIRVGFTSLALVIFFLALLDRLQVWHVFILVGLAGMGRAFDNVVRQALLGDLVQGEGLMNAVALTRIARDITQMIGPLVGGFMLDNAGLAPTYGLVVVVHLTAVFTSWRLRAIPRVPTGTAISFLANLAHTFRYVKRQEVVMALLLMAFLVNLTAFPLNNGLMPVFARDVLGSGPEGLGILLGAYAVGAFLGSGAMAAVKRMGRPGKFLVLSSVGWHAGLLVFSASQWFVPSLGILVVTGIIQSFTMVSMALLLLEVTDADVRGRVMGLRSMAVYGLPMGLLVSGALADSLGAPLALAINAGLGMVLTALIALSLRKLWLQT